MKAGRDDFSVDTKRILGSRVAYKCCYPGCNITTIGPDTNNNNKVVNVGKAAHIHAAAQGGPRYIPDMSIEDRRSVNNGIWMCGNHAWLIDANYGNYSAETLLQWKHTAEAEAYRRLKNMEKEQFPDPTTIVCLSPDLMFEGIWKAANQDTWKFSVSEFVCGNIESLRDYSVELTDRPSSYIIIESQGDGRLINGAFQWEQSKTDLEICVKVAPPVIRRNPNNIGSDISTGMDGDLTFENGDFKIVSGKDLAKEIIERNLSMPLGAVISNPRAGSFFNKYYQQYRNNSALLNRIVKIELTRLITIPFKPEDPADQPELNFINRIHEVRVLEELNGIVPLFVALEWGDGSFWSDTIHVRLFPPSFNRGQVADVLPDSLTNVLNEEPINQLKRLAAQFTNQEELKEKVNAAAIMRLFKELLPEIMTNADTALESEIYPLFNSHNLYRTFDNNSFEYNTSYDLELYLYQRGTAQQLGVTISLKGFKKAGVEAFDVIDDLFIFFNDYNYMIGNNKTHPWLVKMYHQMPSSDEIIRVANQLIDSLITKINRKILAVDTQLLK
ncbi:hypothetical protein ACQ86K_12795 [Mucilaginibacter sp. P19]|uniref:HNH endonuclease n=1 Tax=Mucilaginibacter gossypii TaxID=551996 RepID=A0A1G8D3B4_9SPHI|nr:hypothetical protein [Mucilaginibacter gossypii]SDH52216.1 hypothetical protein SAMN05192573_110112 [Mucilaginibacter gossypii]